MARELSGAGARWRKAPMRLMAAISLLCVAAGCRDAYRDKSEEVYRALLQLKADVETNARTEIFAEHLSAADEARERWARECGSQAHWRRSARELDDALRFYGRYGTMRMIDQARTVSVDTVDDVTIVRGNQALAMARRDLDFGR
jgi:hypothetical protein